MVITPAEQARLLLRKLPHRYPVDLMQLLPHIKTDKPVHVHFSANLPSGAGGFLFCHPGYRRFYILINAHYSLERQRFALAHELGHLALGHHKYADKSMENTRFGENPLYRLEADEFAAEILMPSFAVHKLARCYWNPLSLIYWVRKVFSVSLEAAVRRILQLDICKGAIVLYDHDQVYFAYENFPLDPNPDLFYQFLRRESQTVGKQVHKRVHEPFSQPFDFYCQRKPSGKLLAVCVTNYTPGLYNALREKWTAPSAAEEAAPYNKE